MIRIRTIAALLLPLALLAGCSALSGKREPYTTYAPRYGATPPPSDAAPVGWQLGVELPLTSAALDSRRIAVMPSPGVLEVYKNARWRDTPPALVRDLLVQAFEDSGRIVGVGSAGSSLRGDYALGMELRDFAAEYLEGAPHAVIRLNVKLLDYSTNRVLAARTFDRSEPMDGAGASDAARAFERAFAVLLPRIVEWTLREGEADWQRRSAAPP
jgi:cholesterol transport system auxiliary component